MNKLGLIGGAVVVIGAISAVGVLKAYHPQPVQTQFIRLTAAKAVTVPTPVFGLGDTQGSGGDQIILLSIIAPASPTTDTEASAMSPDDMLVTVKLSTAIDYINLKDQSLIYTSSGQYLKPGNFLTKECPDHRQCMSFLVPRNDLIDTYIYKDFKWQL